MSRTSSLDNLRTFLTTLVIFHHAALPYGGAGTWLYTSPHYSLFSSTPLLVFNLINQTFFMGAFFLLSGYFSSVVASKKSPKQFLKTKWKRLAVPALVYSVAAQPVIVGVIARVQYEAPWGVTGKVVWGVVKSLRGINGPVWYCALLMGFDVGYVVFRPGHFGDGRTGGRDGKKEIKKEESEARGERTVSTAHVLKGLITVSTVAFLVRKPYPIGTTIKMLNLTVGYVPQYVLYYVGGIYINRHLRTELHQAVTKRSEWVVRFLALSIVVFSLAMVQAEVSKPRKDIGTTVDMARGGFNRFALLYAFLNEFVGFALSTFFIPVFAETRVLRRKWKLRRFDIARYSYVAFLAHAPVTVYLQCLGDQVQWGPVSKTLLVGIVGTVMSWGCGWVVKIVVEDLFGLRGYV